MGQKRKTKSKPTRVDKPIEDSEDYCFVCKDGGFLILCDHRDCTKAYHPDCVQKKSSEDSGEQWMCGWHTCCRCGKTSSFRCICCKNAVCNDCIINNEEFAQLKGVYGICADCLKMAIMVEEGRNVDSDGEEVDFNDRESVEGLFKEYWEIMKDKENLSLKDLQAAKVHMEKEETKKSASNKSHSESDEYGPSEAQEEASDNDGDSHVTRKHKLVSKGVKTKRQRKKDKGSKKREFLGWGSKPLIEFLASIGKDTTQKLSQGDVANIMINYAQDKKLFDTANKKKIICDTALHSVLGRKSLTIYKIKDFLESHLLENIEESDEDEQGYSSEDEDQKCLLSPKTLKKHRTSTTCEENELVSKKSQTKEAISSECNEDNASPVVAYSCFASIIPENIRLVYLKRSLFEELLKKPETFDHKVLGSFVKVKSDAAFYKHRYQLLQVTGIVKPADENKTSVVLKLSSLPDDVPISMLSDDDFSKEECEELRQKVENSIVERPTVVDLQEKVKILHEDITKHSIPRELVVLQHRIDLANEKGRRDLFYQCVQQRKLLQSPDEQARRLRMVPQVIADVIVDDHDMPISKDPEQDDSSNN